MAFLLLHNYTDFIEKSTYKITKSMYVRSYTNAPY